MVCGSWGLNRSPTLPVLHVVDGTKGSIVSIWWQRKSVSGSELPTCLQSIKLNIILKGHQQAILTSTNLVVTIFHPPPPHTPDTEIQFCREGTSPYPTNISSLLSLLLLLLLLLCHRRRRYLYSRCTMLLLESESQYACFSYHMAPMMWLQDWMTHARFQVSRYLRDDR